MPALRRRKLVSSSRERQAGREHGGHSGIRLGDQPQPFVTAAQLAPPVLRGRYIGRPTAHIASNKTPGD